MSVLTSLALMIGLGLKPESNHDQTSEIEDLKLEIEYLKFQLESVRQDRDFYMRQATIPARHYQQAAQALHQQQAGAGMLGGLGGLGAQGMQHQDFSGLSGLICNCVPARHDFLIQ